MISIKFRDEKNWQACPQAIDLSGLLAIQFFQHQCKLVLARGWLFLGLFSSLKANHSRCFWILFCINPSNPFVLDFSADPNELRPAARLEEPHGADDVLVVSREAADHQLEEVRRQD